MEIYEPKVNPELQKQQNLGKCLIFLQILHFSFILKRNTHRQLHAFLCSTSPQMSGQSQAKLHEFRDFS
jgi:hypothetical protein